ncbi:MAG: S-adenosylmethionine:tRNA ribosyltransferase-isomerase [Solirubrobacterales bacterium]|nr:S-adenosylmethionine:tRNA ribosyltransferase-isomerase [Solirubrobacterales bacterium]MBV9810342.1 S-adenosylmethionine:tRNA ribosyltransferase-isomerase [Solirubrobacterales bacterium]
MSALAFELQPALEAHEPPEARGIPRDGVRLLVAHRHDGSIEHGTFRDLPELLEPGDVIVVNVSATIPAAVPARRPNESLVRVHFATRAPHLEDDWRVVEMRSADGARPARLPAGERLELRGGAALELVAPYASGQRLMLARFCCALLVDEYLEDHGEPIRYAHVPREWPLDAYQNVYAISPGSAEMPSAGRPFTRELISRLIARDITVAPITLHTGVSSPESHEPPFPEWFEVPERTAETISAARERGGRVIAVGTTVVRALESAAAGRGCTCARSGWTSHVITPECGVRTIDGLITGWHDPDASHLLMLEAVAGAELLQVSYAAALDSGYLWHEFGDSHLILP